MPPYCDITFINATNKDGTNRLAATKFARNRMFPAVAHRQGQLGPVSFQFQNITKADF